MTIKEIATVLNVSKKEIMDMVNNNLITSFRVERSIYNSKGFLLRKEYQIEIDPEEVEYIDWWINVGRKKTQKELVKYYYNHTKNDKYEALKSKEKSLWDNIFD